jgi:hypothetical protein
MAAFVKQWTNPTASLPRYSRLTLAEEVRIGPTKNLLGTVISNALFIDSKDGKILSEVKANQSFIIRVGSVRVESFSGLYQPAAALYQLCDVAAPVVLESGEETVLDIRCKAREAFSVEDLAFVARLYVVD